MKKGEKHRWGEINAGNYVNTKFVLFTDKLKGILKETYIIGYREGYIKREEDLLKNKPSRLIKENENEQNKEG